MTRAPRKQGVFLLSLLFAAAPFVFGLLRAIGSRHDLRALWMSIASFVGATIVMALGLARSRTPRAIGSLAAAVLVVATLFAGTTAIGLGFTSGPGIWAVSIVLGLCWAASALLQAIARPGAG